MIKKTLCAVLSAVILLTVTACQSSSDSPPVISDSSTVSSDEAFSESEEADSKEESSTEENSSEIIAEKNDKTETDTNSSNTPDTTPPTTTPFTDNTTKAPETESSPATTTTTITTTTTTTTKSTTKAPAPLSTTTASKAPAPEKTTTTTKRTTPTTTTTTTITTKKPDKTTTTTKVTTTPAPVAPNNTMRDITTMELVRDMGLGINLGNTMESCGAWINSGSVRNYETAWGSPVITKAMIKGYKDCGFDSLRIPVAWSNRMGSNYQIDSEYIARVKEIADMAIDSGLYVIINIHWDGGWFSDFAYDNKREEAFRKYEAIWTQLSEAFKDYGDYLIFESLNEEGGWNEVWNQWSHQGDKNKSYGILNDMNSRFVNIVRKSGGNNKYRHLLIAGYGTDIDLTCDSAFKMPNDPQNRCAVSVHYYTPSTFAVLEKDADWGKASPTWGTDYEKTVLYGYMDKLKTHFVDKGIPVIIGEYGCPTNNKDRQSVNLFISEVAKAAYSRGMCPVLWDYTNLHYNRTTCKFVNSDMLKMMMEAKTLR